MDPHPFQLLQDIATSHHVNHPAKNSPLFCFSQIQNMIHVYFMNQTRYPFPSIERIPYRVEIPYSTRAGLNEPGSLTYLLDFLPPIL